MCAAVAALIKEEQTTKKREQWEDWSSFEDGSEKEYLCRAAVDQALLAGLPQSFSTTDLGCKKKNLHRSMESQREVSRYRTLYSQVLQQHSFGGFFKSKIISQHHLNCRHAQRVFHQSTVFSQE